MSLTKTLETMVFDLLAQTKNRIGRTHLWKNSTSVILLLHGVFECDGLSPRATTAAVELLRWFVPEGAADIVQHLLSPLVRLLETPDRGRPVSMALIASVVDLLDEVANAHASTTSRALRDALPVLVQLLPLNAMRPGRTLKVLPRLLSLLITVIDRHSADEADVDVRHIFVRKGGIPPLVALLGTEGVDRLSTQGSQVLQLLDTLAFENVAVKDALRMTGGLTTVASLVVHRDDPTRVRAVQSLCHFVEDYPANKKAVAESPAVLDYLMETLSVRNRVRRLNRLSQCALLEEVFGTAPAVPLTPDLLERMLDAKLCLSNVPLTARAMHTTAMAMLQRADAQGIRTALAHAADLEAQLDGRFSSTLDFAAVAVAHSRLADLADAESRRRRWKALGLSPPTPPIDFVCPITHEAMVDPVVALDGHSYERAAISRVLSEGNGLSPLTRAPLDPDAIGAKRVFYPNHALLKRMRDHEEDVLATVEAAHGTKRQRSGSRNVR